jgi:hypothetical protein
MNYTAYNYGPSVFANVSDNLSFTANYTYRAPALFWQYMDEDPLPGQSEDSVWASPSYVIA